LNLFRVKNIAKRSVNSIEGGCFAIHIYYRFGYAHLQGEVQRHRTIYQQKYAFSRSADETRRSHGDYISVGWHLKKLILPAAIGS